MGSIEPVGHTTKTRRRTTGPYTGVKTRLQRKKEDEEIGMEEAKDRIAANPKVPNYLEGEPENRTAEGPLPLNLGEFLQNPTYSGNFNQITKPCDSEFTKDDEVRDSVYFWKMYKDKIVPDEPDNSRATMDSLGRIVLALRIIIAASAWSRSSRTLAPSCSNDSPKIQQHNLRDECIECLASWSQPCSFLVIRDCC